MELSDNGISFSSKKARQWLSSGFEFAYEILVDTYEVLYKNIGFDYLLSWNGILPDPATFKPDTDGIYWLDANENYHIIFHPEHKKLGQNIIEIGSPFRKDIYMFIDYKQLCDIYIFLDKCMDLDDIAWDFCPNIIPYRADPEDRAVFGTPTALWDLPEYQ